MNDTIDSIRERLAEDEITQAMAHDLDLIDIIEAIGSPTAKRKANQQRKAIFAEIRRLNKQDGLDNLTTDELLSELEA